MKTPDTPHQPVLLNQVLEVLEPRAGETYLDGTAGFGGHAAAVLEQLGPEGQAILVDRDAIAIDSLRRRFGDGVRLMHGDFVGAAERLLAEGQLVNMVLLDLGVSSPQLDEADRGFSFKHDVPLDMRMDRSQTLTAAELVNRSSQVELERILREYGEEPKARAVARAIVAARPLSTTGELARAVRRAAYAPREIDPATRSFQAVRIAVNEELELLDKALPLLLRLLVPGGRLAVISFHSLEDRLVKLFFDRESKDCICPPKQPICTCGHVATLAKITKGPITAEATEIAFNPRARSAKLRAAEKINKNKRR